MVETGCFFKALPGKGLADKKSQARGSKRSKTILTIAFFVNTAEEKVIELNPVSSKALKILSVPMVITITILVKKGE